jgi:hypothetical protein
MSVAETATSTAQAKEPVFEVAQLAHVELLTPKPEETLRFFTELLGLVRNCPLRTVSPVGSNGSRYGRCRRQSARANRSTSVRTRTSTITHSK